jgi:imidazoleglycerol phosphate synthase glutamine amidotransferase subunit HisH
MAFICGFREDNLDEVKYLFFKKDEVFFYFVHSFLLWSDANKSAIQFSNPGSTVSVLMWRA